MMQTSKFIKVENFLQAKALLENDYIVFIGEKPIISFCFFHNKLMTTLSFSARMEGNISTTSDMKRFLLVFKMACLHDQTIIATEM